MKPENNIKVLSDEALMLEVKIGNDACFGELLRRYERQLLSFIYRQLGDKELARDILMDVFLRIYKSAERYEPRAKFTTYIYQVTRNLCINESKKRAVRKTDSLDAMGEETGFEYADKEMNPAEVYETHERQRLVQKALDELPEDQRTIIILAEFQEMPYEKIAQIMGCSLGTVKSRMFRARKKIKEWMENHAM